MLLRSQAEHPDGGCSTLVGPFWHILKTQLDLGQFQPQDTSHASHLALSTTFALRIFNTKINSAMPSTLAAVLKMPP